MRAHNRFGRNNVMVSIELVTGDTRCRCVMLHKQNQYIRIERRQITTHKNAPHAKISNQTTDYDIILPLTHTLFDELFVHFGNDIRTIQSNFSTCY